MEELAEEAPICKMPKVVTEKPTMIVEEKLLLVPELIKPPGEEVAEDDIMLQVFYENQTNFEQRIAYRSSPHEANYMIQAKLVVEQEIRIPGIT